MKQTGIWLDKEKALIVTIENDTETLSTVTSNVEHFKIHGGSGTRFKGGPQDVVQDSKYLEREKHQLKKYFAKVAAQITDADSIVIFGPAQTNTKFYEELQVNYKPIAAKVQAVTKADSMTDNQIKALVKDFFKPNGK